ncbi:MAG: hypothetical protein Fur006_05920 [Coleofasciculaceae cyanobacterium]
MAWTPTAEQFGANLVALKVSDGQFTVIESFTINMSDRTVNRLLSINSTP